jgi:hypothetical protein
MVTEERRLAGINGINVARVKQMRRAKRILWFIVPIAAIVLGGWFLDARARNQTKRNEELIAAVTSGNLDGVRAAITNGADANAATEKSNNTSREKSAWARVKEALHIRPKSTGTPALLVALSTIGKKEIALELLRHGASVNVADSSGWTPLMFAIQVYDEETAEEVLRHGANVNARSNDDISIASLAAEQGTRALLAHLLKSGANPNVKDNEGKTSLIRAAISGRPDSVTELLKHGADSTISDKRGRTALFWAAVLYRDTGAAEEDLKQSRERFPPNIESWGVIGIRVQQADKEGRHPSGESIVKQLEKDYKDIVIQLAPLCKNGKQVDNSGESADAIIAQIVGKGLR